MIINKENPESFDPGLWHHDLGNFQRERRRLLSIAIRLLEIDGKDDAFLFAIKVPEPGLIYLEISISGRPAAEVYCTRAEYKDEYSLYLDPRTSSEVEFITSDTSELATRLLIDD